MRLSFAAFLLFLFVSASTARAAEPAITNLAGISRNGRISISFALRNGFDSPEIIRNIRSGAQTGFTYRVELYRNRPNWFDQRVGRARIDVVCTFDSTTREYVVSYRRNRKLVRSQSFSDFEMVKEKMSSIVEQDLFHRDYKPYKLSVRVRAELIRDYLFYVVPWDVTTDWKEARVRNSEEAH
jgi:hypothetical protein